MAQARLDMFMNEIFIAYCPCNKYLERSKWKSFKTIKEVVAKRIRLHYPKAELEFPELDLPESFGEEKENEVIAKIKEGEQVIKVILKLSKCSLCEKQGTEYFEAVLQIRSSSMHVLEKSVELLKQKVENLRHRGMFINKVQPQREGYDLYMTNKKLAQALGRELYDAYGGMYKASPHLYSKNKQTSKNIYRVNVFIRLPGFEKGDFIVSTDDRVYRVEKLGKQLKLLDLEKGKNVIITYPKLSYHLLKPHSTYVSRIYPKLEVIHPFDYQSFPVKNIPEKKYESGEEINVVVHKGVYVVD